MCGIIGYVGEKKALPILIQGLKRLEYRGYDSAGVAIAFKGSIKRWRSVGKVDALEEKVKDIEGNIGIGHTRWATHGGVTEKNAHPHFSFNKHVVVVHNGIIENYREIKKKIPVRKYNSETDSEVLANLIEYYYFNSKKKTDLFNAVKQALLRVRGTYGLLVMSKHEPGKIVVARLGSPVVIGVGKEECYIASDSLPIIPYTHKMLFLDDREVACVTKNDIEVHGLKKGLVKKKIKKLEYSVQKAEKNKYKSFMLKEIYEQADVLQDAIRGRLNRKEGIVNLGGINMSEREMRRINKVIFVACGTAHHASLIGKYLFEKLTYLPCSAEVASEFRYCHPVLDKKTLVFAVSQSGETADTLAAIKEVQKQGAYTRGIVNVIGSTIAREVEGGTYIHAGPELSVASTKAYTNMVAVMILYALQFGRLKCLDADQGKEIIDAFLKIPSQMKAIFKESDKIRKIARKYKDYKDFLYLGRGLNYPVALEGALKLKEISYIHSEGCAAGEMKHGTNALLSPQHPVMAIVTKNSSYEKMCSNIAEVKARNSKVIAIASQRDNSIAKIVDDVIYVPRTHEVLEPLLNTIPLQIFAYHVASLLKRDIDRPRNLAKSVTVE